MSDCVILKMKKQETFPEEVFAANRSSFVSSPKAILPGAVCATFLWGCAYPALKAGYEAFGVGSGDVPALLVFAGVRFLLAGLAALVIAGLVGRKLPIPGKGGLPAICSLALLQTFGQYAFYYVGLANTTGVRASILNAASSFLTVILSALVWKEREKLSPGKVLGCLMGLAGVALVNLGPGLGDAPFRFAGEGMILLASLMMSLGSLAGKLTMEGQEPLTVTGWQLALGGLGLLIIGGLNGGQLGMPDWRGALLMAFMVFISAAAFALWTTLIKYHSISKVAVFSFLTPIFGAMLSGLFLGEKLLSPVTLLALALVALGIRQVNRG